MNHWSNCLPFMHNVESVSNLIKRVFMCNEFINLELSRKIFIYIFRKHCAPLGAPESGPSPRPPCNKLERPCGDLYSAGCHTDYAGLPPTLMTALQRSTHGLSQPDALKSIVYSTGTILHCHFNQNILDGFVVVFGVDANSGAKLHGSGKFVGVDIHSDDLGSPSHLSTHDAGQTHPSKAKDSHLGPSFNFHGVHHSAIAGGDTTTKQANLFQRSCIINFS
mmetsp:Transcript_26074/g.33727  ORF Transcript_26074/g.33727 Transcript_26074/m.33727 type:complete len:221 (+) Transcript_26074:280-942(+)